MMLSTEKIVKLDKPTLGVCYYPEHWPEHLWENDLDRMLELGLETVRIAEFAWNKFEPEEGIFTFEFFDRFLNLANEKGMKVILGTPTATPPAWLSHKYPEILNARVDGTLYRHGMRRHYNYNSTVYRKYVARIVEQLARHYCSFPNVIGWQIDNELNAEANVFYSESDQSAFRNYLKEKFKSLDTLNEAMGTVFWNQTYTSWEEIYLTRPTVSNSNNPHLSLEEKRFISQSTIDFCKIQADIIKKYKPVHQFITINGIFEHVDIHQLTESVLDFITYDSYPNFAYDTWTNPKKPGNLNDRRNSFALTRARSVSPVFGIMEQQSGAGGWDVAMKQPAPKPGQMRLWTFQSLAHGADFISYFRWRTSPIGTEIYWHGLNDYSNENNRRLDELKRIRDDFRKLKEIAGARYLAKVALVKDYDNLWDGEQDKWHGPLDSYSDDGWFTACQFSHTPLDLLYLSKKTTVMELSKYELLIYPHATILTEVTANLLNAYVKQGGVLVLGARTGYKDEFGRCPMRPLPGFAQELCGVTVIDYTHIGPGDDEEFALWDGEEMDAPIFNDILSPTGNASVLGVFKGNYYNDAPALVQNRYGNGTTYYFGAGFSVKTAGIFLNKLGFATPYSEILDLPQEAELSVRRKGPIDYLFILNYQAHELEIQIKTPLVDLITGKKLNGKTKILPYGVIILKYQKN